MNSSFYNNSLSQTKSNFSLYYNTTLSPSSPKLNTNDDNQLKPSSTTLGKWTKDEHRKFIEGLLIYGNQWKKIQKYISSRTTIQVRSHSQKFFMKLKKKYIELYGKEDLKERNKYIVYEHILYVLTQNFDCEFMLNFFAKINMITCDKNIQLKNILLKKRNSFLDVIYTILTNTNIHHKNIHSSHHHITTNDSSINQSKHNSLDSTSVNGSIEKDEDNNNIYNDNDCIQSKIDLITLLDSDLNGCDNIFNISFTYEEQKSLICNESGMNESITLYD